MCNCHRQKQPFPPLNTVTLCRRKGSSAAGLADVNKISAEKAIVKECVWLAGVKQGKCALPGGLRGKAVCTWSVFCSARKSKHWWVSVAKEVPFALLFVFSCLFLFLLLSLAFLCVKLPLLLLWGCNFWILVPWMPALLSLWCHWYMSKQTQVIHPLLHVLAL